MATVRFSQLLPFLLGFLVGIPLVLLVMDWRARSESFPMHARTRYHAPGIQTKIPEKDIGRTEIVIGSLGRPLGERVTIRGRLEGHHKSPEKYFRVDSVNGQARGVLIMIAGLDEWPNGTNATFRGCEIGIITDGVNGRTYQELHLRFRVDEVVEPRSLSFDYKSQLRP